MTFAFAIVLFYAGLLLVVIPIHELGHFLVARHYGFKIQEYFVGFGPKLWSTRRGEIEYGIKALPVGGYVKIAGMNPYEKIAPEDLSRVYGSKPRWQRALVIAAGPLSHLLIAMLLFSLWTGITHVDRYRVSDDLQVTTVVPRLNGEPSPASLAGIEPGDSIVQVGPVAGFSAGIDRMTTYTTDHAGEPVPVTVVRGGVTMTFDVTPVLAKGADGETIGRIGVMLAQNYATDAGWLDAGPLGARLVGTNIVETVRQIGHVFGPEGISRVFRALFLGAPRAADSPQSVVGIGQTVGHSAQQNGLVDVLFILGFVTVFVGLLNLVPLPPFDGGHLAVLVIEKLRGKTIDMRKLIPVSAVVMTFLIVFVGATLVLDLVKPVPLSP